MRFVRPVILLLILLCFCDAKKRVLKYWATDWEFGDRTIDCFRQTIDNLPTVAMFNYETNLCYTGDDFNRTVNTYTVLILESYEPVVEPSNLMEVKVIPSVLNFWESNRNRTMSPMFEVRIPSNGVTDGSRMLIEFIDNIGVTNLAIKLEYYDNMLMNTTFQDGAGWKLAPRKNLTHLMLGSAGLKVNLMSERAEVVYFYDEVKEIEKTFEPFQTIRFSSNFTTCDRIFFYYI